MVEAAREGTFVLEARHDILVEAIGTDEHGGRVCGVGEGVCLRSFFGSQRKKSSMDTEIQREKIESFEKKLEEQRRMLEEEREKREKDMERFQELYSVCALLEMLVFYRKCMIYIVI